MSVLSLSEKLDLASLETQDPAVISCGQAMAENIFENAVDFLEGGRSGFYAAFGLTMPVHRIAIVRFEGMLSQTDYGKRSRAAGRYAELATDNDPYIDYLVTRERVAEKGGRGIVAKVMSGLDEVENKIVTSDVFYEHLVLPPRA